MRFRGCRNCGGFNVSDAVLIDGLCNNCLQLPNPWVDEAPPCPDCGVAAYFWAEGALRWFCPPCRHRFDIAVEAVA